jgi:hypothetical protein
MRFCAPRRAYPGESALHVNNVRITVAPLAWPEPGCGIFLLASVSISLQQRLLQPGGFHCPHVSTWQRSVVALSEKRAASVFLLPTRTGSSEWPSFCSLLPGDSQRESTKGDSLWRVVSYSGCLECLLVSSCSSGSSAFCTKSVDAAPIVGTTASA